MTNGVNSDLMARFIEHCMNGCQKSCHTYSEANVPYNQLVSNSREFSFKVGFNIIISLSAFYNKMSKPLSSSFIKALFHKILYRSMNIKISHEDTKFSSYIVLMIRFFKYLVKVKVIPLIYPRVQSLASAPTKCTLILGLTQLVEETIQKSTEAQIIAIAPRLE